ncbi:MAG: ATP-dependent Clp protease ATP-binding subunit [Prevotella sp.]
MTSRIKHIAETTHDESPDIMPWAYDITNSDSDFPPVDDDDDDDDTDSRPRSFSDMLSEASRMLSNAMQKQQTRILDNGRSSDTPLLDKFSTDLTSAAMNKRLDPVVGRHDEITRMSEILCRRKKNNPVLIGDPGVGKSAIVEGLAQQIADGTSSPLLRGRRLLALDMTGIVAGTKYRGDFEERIKGIISELESHPNIIVFIDEIHTIIGAGSASGSMDAANILKPALARGTIQCIGATTLEEYRKSIEKDGALERRFQKIIVNQTTTEETLLILQNIKERYQQYHHVIYSDEALEACVAQTSRYINDRSFPDKAIDALDEVGARVHLRSTVVSPKVKMLEAEIKTLDDKKRRAVQNQNFELAAALRDQRATLQQRLDAASQTGYDDGERYHTVTDVDVNEIISVMSGVPVQHIGEAETQKLKNLPSRLKAMVIGQDHAVDSVAKAIQRNRLGLRAHNRPIGVFMFLGPTGVGKTYLAQQIAREVFGLKESLIRVDMSEYNESFNTSRLVGAPPGYVGYDEGGQLTERVRRHPYSVVLLDEIEKAHQNVYNMLLQVFDEGRLTDGNGRLIDFRNTIIIMTSNTGTRQLKEFGNGIGFGSSAHNGTATEEQNQTYAHGVIQKALARQFAPEFLNRLDEVVTFNQLTPSSLRRIVDIELRDVVGRMKTMGYSLRISDKSKDFLASQGYDVQFGARPLRRTIQQQIEDRVCDMILNNDIHPGTVIKVKMPRNATSLQFVAEEAKETVS